MPTTEMTEAQTPGWSVATRPPPQCGKRGCVLKYQDSANAFAVVYQHGDNPEAILEVDAISTGSAVLAAVHARKLVSDWVDRVHEYEDRRLADSAPGRAGDEEADE